MIFTHHPRPETEFTFDPSRRYEQPSSDMKPQGLWLSVDDDWRRWCDTEDMDWIGSSVDFHLDLDRCLVLSTVAEIDAFTAANLASESQSYGSLFIDWTKVAADHAGIVIAPYQWARRLDGDSRWDYGWDCASACAWDLSAVRVSVEAAS